MPGSWGTPAGAEIPAASAAQGGGRCPAPGPWPGHARRAACSFPRGHSGSRTPRSLCRKRLLEKPQAPLRGHPHGVTSPASPGQENPGLASQWFPGLRPNTLSSCFSLTGRHITAFISFPPSPSFFFLLFFKVKFSFLQKDQTRSTLG